MWTILFLSTAYEQTMAVGDRQLAQQHHSIRIENLNQLHKLNTATGTRCNRFNQSRSIGFWRGLVVVFICAMLMLLEGFNLATRLGNLECC